MAMKKILMNENGEPIELDYDGVKLPLNGYYVKNIQSTVGHEGRGGPKAWSATIYKHGKKLGTVFDDSWGGCYNYDFDNNKDYDELEKHVATFPEIPMERQSWMDEDPSPMKLDIDCFIGALVDEIETMKAYEKKCKSKILYRLKDQSPNSYMEWNVVFCKKTKDMLIEEHGDNIAEIINESIGQVADDASNDTYEQKKKDDEVKRLKRQCQNKTVFKMKKDGKEGEYSMKRVYNADTKKYLEDRFGNDLIEIINERYL